jgi:hypothetical protein
MDGLAPSKLNAISDGFFVTILIGPLSRASQLAIEQRDRGTNFIARHDVCAARPRSRATLMTFYG